MAEPGGARVPADPERLAEAERQERANHRPVCRWGHSMDGPGRGDCVGECAEDCECCGEEWPCATDVLLAEYDRRGAVIDELSARLVAVERDRDRLQDLATNVLRREPRKTSTWGDPDA